MEHILFNDRYPAMPWDAVDTVVFDIGNVLLDFHPSQVLRQVYGEDEAKRARMARVFASPYWVCLDRGTLDRAELARLTCGGDESLRAEILALLQRFPEYKHPVEPGLAILRACKARGKRVLALSNYGRESFEDVVHRFPFFALLDGYVVSAYEEMVKPEREIYARLVARYALDPTRTLFLDDNAANVEGALYAGLHAMLFDPDETPAFFGVEG